MIIEHDARRKDPKTLSTPVSALRERYGYPRGSSKPSAVIEKGEALMAGHDAGEAASIIGLAPGPRDGGVILTCCRSGGGRHGLRHVLFQATLPVACHNSLLEALSKRLKEKVKQHKSAVVAIGRQPITVANAVFKSGTSRQYQSGT